jgi:hypothetical protein
MGNEREQPFDSIESTQEFMALLKTTVGDALAEIELDRQEALGNGDPRRVEALDLAVYKLKLLENHVQKSSRLLNDLRSIRRLLYRERAAAVSQV